MREVFTTRHRSKTGRDIDAACVDALITLSDDPLDTARFLALVGTMDRPVPASRLCEGGLKRMGSAGYDALLVELGRPHAPARIRKLARLLTRLSRVPPPEPLSSWASGEPGARQAVVTQWRQRLLDKGALDPRPTSQPAGLSPPPAG